MLVYGDRETWRSVRREIATQLGAWRGLGQSTGLARHEAIVGVFLAIAELAQGLADRAFATTQCDDPDPASDATLDALVAIAACVIRSWDSATAAAPSTVGMPASHRRAEDALLALLALDLPETILCRDAEGYAFYALYPETYALAARRSGLGRNTHVIGLRSIGTGLAAMVAAELGGRATTLRPHGDPFHRTLRIVPELEKQLLADAEASYAIVDEGPGLSGSSFGCVIDWLMAHGIPAQRIHAFPSHHGALGPKASAAHRAQWQEITRHSVTFDEVIAPHLARWIADLAQTPQITLADLSGGRWRSGDESDWPASNPQQERRKLRARGPGMDWLARFAGLGVNGRRKLERARRLADAGFSPKPIGLLHGFLIEEWHADATPITSTGLSALRLVEHLGRYLGFRARCFPAPPSSGATGSELVTMAVRNTTLAIGHDAALILGEHLRRHQPDDQTMRRVETDNRMRFCEWLVASDGRILKTDAIDHCEAHDLIGCQPIEWDIAGAIMEFDLDAASGYRLAGLVSAQSGEDISEDLLAFMATCYAAFQMGAAVLAMQALAGDDAEVVRLNREAQRYQRVLRQQIDAMTSH